jgi:N6-L-threonylcarbamoyladenine synthase
MKYVLGIESTAHTFSASVVTSGGRILSNARSIYKAKEGGGIHPFEAAKSHFDNAESVLRQSFQDAGIGPSEVDAVCYSMGPGLGPCLRVGAVVARSLAISLGAPLVPVNHAVGHIELGCLLCKTSDPVVLLVSGGHTMVIAHSGPKWRVLGETLDLTLGQLLDQFGRHSGLASPCGRAIEQAATASSEYTRLPYSVKGNDVSFSGLLTAAKNAFDAGKSFEEMCFSIQETAFAMVVEVTERALAFTGKKEVMIVGGVAANKRLSAMMETMVARHEARYRVMPLEFSGDCGAQIAWTGYLCWKEGVVVPVEGASVKQSWRLDLVDTPWRK